MVTPTKNNTLSKLDASMVHCGVVFIFAYRFNGTIDIEQFNASVNAVIGHVARFQQSIILQENYQAQWQDAAVRAPLLRTIEVDDLDQALECAYQNIDSNHQTQQHPPMFFTLYIDRNQPNNFIVSQSGKHSYCDGKSAIALFNHVLQHYSAALCNDLTTQQNIVDNICSLSSPGPDDLYALRANSQRLINIGRWQHICNILRLMTYKVSDRAQYATPHSALPARLQEFRHTPSTPLLRSFNISALIRYCDSHCPQVSPHNMICALVAKASYALNCAVKKQPDAHQISFRVMVDILNAPMRGQYIGNYIAYLPVTVDGRLPLHVIAAAINERLLNARQNREDISMYKLLEFALGSGMANKRNDPVSYIIANIDNISLTHNPHMLQGAQYQQFCATANAAPVNLGGAQLNNRPTVCFNLAADNRLLLSFFNTVTDPQINSLLLDNIDAELKKLLQPVSETAAIPAGT